MTRSIAHIRIRGTTYHFRRRVSKELVEAFGQPELCCSLATSDSGTARKRATALWIETERIYDMVNQHLLDKQEAVKILRRLLSEPVTGTEVRADLVEMFKTPGSRWSEIMDQAMLLTRELPLDGQAHLSTHFQRIGDAINVVVADSKVKYAEGRAGLAELKEFVANGKFKIERARRGQERQRADYMSGKVDALSDVINSGGVARNDPPSAPSPLFSAKIEEFLAHKLTKDDDGKCYSEQTVLQVRKTFDLWRELIGDIAVQKYTREQAGEFRALLLKLPASHGKGRNGETARQAIERNNAAITPKPRLKLKTAKRHFSALQQYWKWLKNRGLVSEVIFSGFEFPGTKSTKKKRDDWSAADLQLVFAYGPWFGSQADRQSAFFWLPLLALFTGMRLEEMARLRPVQDFSEIDGVACIVVQPHEDGWNPKTEAGERLIPIHTALIRLGFLAFVEQRKNAPRLFGDLKPGGPDRKYGYAYSRTFSKVKISLGVAQKTAYHSFRHTVRTILSNTPAEKIRDVWIDAVVGHDPGEPTQEDSKFARRQSEGVITYTKRVGIHNLVKVVEAIVSPVDISHLVGQ